MAVDRYHIATRAKTGVVSVNTMRTHVRHIYSKPGVHRRDHAIAAAQQRGWLVM